MCHILAGSRLAGHCPVLHLMQLIQPLIQPVTELLVLSLRALLSGDIGNTVFIPPHQDFLPGSSITLTSCTGWLNALLSWKNYFIGRAKNNRRWIHGIILSILSFSERVKGKANEQESERSGVFNLFILERPCQLYRRKFNDILQWKEICNYCSDHCKHPVTFLF